jgi:hypothetical protein
MQVGLLRMLMCHSLVLPLLLLLLLLSPLTAAADADAGASWSVSVSARSFSLCPAFHWHDGLRRSQQQCSNYRAD